MHLNRWQSWLVRLLGAAALIAGIFWFIPFSEVIASLRGLNLGYVAAAFVLTLIIAGFEACQLWMLLERVGIPIGPWRVFETKFISRFYGQFLPNELLAAAVKLHRLAGPTKQWGEAVAALAFTRLVNTGALLLLGLAFWAIEMPSGLGRWIGVVLFGMIAVLAALHIVLASPSVNRHAQRLFAMRMFAWLRGTLVDRVRKFTKTIVDSYRLFGGMIWTITFIALIRHGLGILNFALAALALDIHLSFLTIGWIRVVLQALMMLPIHVSGIAVRLGSLVILLQEYSVPANRAVALGFLLFAINLVSNSMGGLFELKNLFRGKRSETLAHSGTK